MSAEPCQRNFVPYVIENSSRVASHAWKYWFNAQRPPVVVVEWHIHELICRGPPETSFRVSRSSR